MTWPVHNRFVVRGSLDGTEEIWSNTLHFPSNVTAAPDVHPSDWDASAVDAAVNAFYGSSRMANACAVDGWRGYRIGTNGNLIGNDMVRRDYTTKVHGTGATQYPPQVALVISLHANNRGPAQRGRIYMPCPGPSISSGDFEISSVGASTFANDFKTYVNALLDAMYPSTVVGEGLCNVSGSGTGTLQAVTEIRVGRALDTMRSRRNKLLERYEVVAL